MDNNANQGVNQPKTNLSAKGKRKFHELPPEDTDSKNEKRDTKRYKRFKNNHSSTESGDIIKVEVDPFDLMGVKSSDEEQISKEDQEEEKLPEIEQAFELKYLKKLDGKIGAKGYNGLLAIKDHLEKTICPICKKKGHYGETCDRLA